MLICILYINNSPSTDWDKMTRIKKLVGPRRRNQAAGFTAPGSDVLGAMSTTLTAYNGGNDENAFALVRLLDEPYGLDFEQLMKDSRIGSKKVFVVGKINSRKTTLLKAIAYLRSQISSGGRLPRTSIENTSRRNNVAEFEIFARELRSRPVSFTKPTNPLAHTYGFTIEEHIVTIDEMFAYSNNGKMPEGINDFANRIALFKMFNEMAEFASVPLFRWILQHMQISDVVRYETLARESFIEQIHQQFEGQALPDSLVELLARESNTDPESVVRSARTNYFAVDKILKGKYGTIFSGTDSLALELQQRVVSKDYTALTDDAVALMQSFMWRLRKSSLNRMDRRFMVHTTIHDENSGKWKYPSYGVNFTDSLKQGRDNEELIMVACHRLRDYMGVAGGNDQLRMLATTFYRDFDVWIIGQLGLSDIDDLREVFPITNVEEKVITDQMPGQFSVKIGNEPMIFIDINPLFTPTLQRISYSNAALDNALHRDVVVADEFVVLEDWDA
jgi:hypothetical protein